MNIRDLINHLERIAELSGENQFVKIIDPDDCEWYGVTGMTFGGGDNIVRLYNDEN